MAKKVSKAQVNSIHYLQMIKDHFSNVKIELEFDIKDRELKDLIPANKQKLKEANKEINEISNCISWIKKQ